MSDSPGSESDIQWLEGILYHSEQPSHFRGWPGLREIVACIRIGNKAVPISHLTIFQFETRVLFTNYSKIHI